MAKNQDSDERHQSEPDQSKKAAEQPGFKEQREAAKSAPESLGEPANGE